MTAIKHSGKVYLVGAGPGDPGLLTQRGAECLRQADVVLFDYLANAALLDLAGEQTRLICVGKHGQPDGPWTQERINVCLLEHARAGRCVVRLKGGDPMVFARAVEELEALVEAEIEFEIVPGITAGLAAASYAGIPLTHRELASAVALVTGHQAAGNQQLDYRALADFPGTLVFYMGVTTVDDWSTGLLRAGKPPATPVAVVRHCSRTDQHVWHTRLDQVADTLHRTRLRPPVVMIVGDVAGLADRYNWWGQQPLHGISVLVTRPLQQAQGLARPLEALGAQVLCHPTIEIQPPASWDSIDDAIDRLHQFDWIVFASSNAVVSWMQRVLRRGDIRQLGGVRLAVIGPGTAAALAQFHLTADLVPAVHQAEALAEALEPQANGRRFLLPRADRGRTVLAERLTAAGAAVESVVAYRSIDVDLPQPEVIHSLQAGQIDWMTVSSPAIARSLVRLFGDELAGTKLASISPLTSDALRELGWQPAAEAINFTMDGLVEAIVAAQQG